MLVDLLATDLDGDVLQHHQAEPLGPSVAGRQGGDVSLEVHLVDQVTIAGDGASHTLVEVGGAVEGLLNRLNREVSVPTVHNLEEGNLGVTGKIHVLCAISNELK